MLQRFLPALLLFYSLASQAELRIDDAWIKHLPPPIPVRAGYMTLSNSGSSAIVIQSVRSEAFAQIEIHRSTESDGMMSMEPVPQLTIEADSSVQLAPGGLHLMMMQPQVPTQPGDIVRVTIVLQDGKEKVLDMQVRK